MAPVKSGESGQNRVRENAGTASDDNHHDDERRPSRRTVLGEERGTERFSDNQRDHSRAGRVEGQPNG